MNKIGDDSTIMHIRVSNASTLDVRIASTATLYLVFTSVLGVVFKHGILLRNHFPSPHRQTPHWRQGTVRLRGGDGNWAKSCKIMPLAV